MWFVASSRIRHGWIFTSPSFMWNAIFHPCHDSCSSFMMTSSYGNIFRVTGPLCGEFTGRRWIPRTKASVAEFWCFLWSAPWINGWVNNREAGDLRRHRAQYDVIVMLRYNQYTPFHCSTSYSMIWWEKPIQHLCVNTLRPRQNGRHFADDTFKSILVNGNIRISIKISLKLFPRGPINNIPAIVQILSLRWSGDKPLSKPMMVLFTDAYMGHSASRS